MGFCVKSSRYLLRMHIFWANISLHGFSDPFVHIKRQAKRLQGCRLQKRRTIT